MKHINLEYKIIRSARKTLALQVKDGQLLVRAPMGMSEKDIEEFVIRKEDWARKHLEMSIAHTI